MALLALGPGLMAPAVARAAGSGSGGQSQLTTSSNPFSGGLTVPGEAATTTAPTTTAVENTSTSESGGGFSGTSAITIAVAAFVIIVGISAAIFRDARKRVGGSRRAEPDERTPGSQRPPKARKLRPAERRRRKRGRAPRRR
jgi:hypothetical protein